MLYFFRTSHFLSLNQSHTKQDTLRLSSRPLDTSIIVADVTMLIPRWAGISRADSHIGRPLVQQNEACARTGAAGFAAVSGSMRWRSTSPSASGRGFVGGTRSLKKPGGVGVYAPVPRRRIVPPPSPAAPGRHAPTSDPSTGSPGCDPAVRPGCDTVDGVPAPVDEPARPFPPWPRR